MCNKKCENCTCTKPNKIQKLVLSDEELAQFSEVAEWLFRAETCPVIKITGLLNKNIRNNVLKLTRNALRTLTAIKRMCDERTDLNNANWSDLDDSIAQRALCKTFLAMIKEGFKGD